MVAPGVESCTLSCVLNTFTALLLSVFASGEDPPNVVLFLVDDLGWMDLS